MNLILCVLFSCVLAAAPVTACGGAGGQSSDYREQITDSQTPQTSGKADSRENDDPDARYEVPAFREAVFSKEAAEGTDEALIDISHINEGYFAVMGDSDSKLKLQVLKGEKTFTYDLVRGRTDFFPVQDGNGEYYIRVMKNLEDSKYFELYSVTTDVTLADEFAPYTITNQYASYTQDSECVKLASSMAAQSKDAHDFISRVYEYITSNVVYDYEKAAGIASGYIPVPDDTLKTNKGICFDYASLAACMLRSQGVPAKIIFGYVAPDDLYHAWNMFYTEDEGWITVEFKADPKQWTRMDLTFTANGSDSSFIGDGSNYTDVYQY